MSSHFHQNVLRTVQVLSPAIITRMLISHGQCLYLLHVDNGHWDVGSMLQQPSSVQWGGQDTQGTGRQSHDAIHKHRQPPTYSSMLQHGGEET